LGGRKRGGAFFPLPTCTSTVNQDRIRLQTSLGFVLELLLI
jgi:hypothetical protein